MAVAVAVAVAAAAAIVAAAVAVTRYRITNSDSTMNSACQLWCLKCIKELYRNESVILNETQFCLFALAYVLEYKYSSCLQN